MKLVFFGSSDFSLSALKACLASEHEVIHVVSTPNRKKGRGLKEFPTPVREFAESQGIEVSTPEKLSTSPVKETLIQAQPELFVVSSYGNFIPKSWLQIPSHLALNVHPSLLPKYRGAAPINWAILNGDKQTGVSIAEVTDKLDAGDIFGQVTVPLDPKVDAAQLSKELAELSAKVLTEVFAKIKSDTLTRTAQRDEDSCYARKLEKDDGWMDWKKPAEEIFNQVRGLLPWPVARLKFESEPVQILEAALGDSVEGSPQPGEVCLIEKQGSLVVQTGKGSLKILQVRPAGKKQMNAAAFANGKRLKPGFVFESVSSNESS